MSQPLDLYHRTNVDAARAIVATGRFLTRENTREAFVSTHVDGQATGYGEAVVHVRVDAADAQLDDEFPVVLVTQGTVKVDPDLLLHPAIEALAGEDVLVVGTTGGLDPAGILARHPGVTNVRLERFIPFPDLLPHVDVVVTNGGYGGTQQALAHGLPVVAAGITEGKNEVAARVRWTGAGIDLRADRATAEQVGRAVRTVLAEPGYRRRAQELAARYAAYDGAPAAVGLIEALVADRTAQAATVPVAS